MYKNLIGKRLLILGGIDAMIEVIERAHELGIEVFVTDYLPDSPAKKYADKSFMVSTTDVDSVVELCRNEKIDGVYTGNVDLLLPYYAQICEKTGFPCYGTLEHFNIMTNKKIFKEICREYNVPTIAEYSKKDIDSNNVNYPVLVKPIDSSGSRGISVCNDYGEMMLAIEKALSYSPSKQYLVEEYMTGDEVVLYYYFQDGNPVFIGMCDRYVNKEQKGVAQLPTAYIFPSKYTDNHISQTDKKVKDMFRGIKMKNGPIFLQAFIKDGIPHIYEPGYRTNGAREQYIISGVTGINSVDMLLNFAFTGTMYDEPIESYIDPKLKGKYACKLSPLICKGTIGSIVGFEEAEKINSVVKIVKNNDISDVISDENIGTLRQIAYRAFIIEDSLEQLKDTIDRVHNLITYYDTNGKSMMIGSFDSDNLITNY